MNVVKLMVTWLAGRHKLLWALSFVLDYQVWYS
jgi:hypothetical protein